MRIYLILCLTLLCFTSRLAAQKPTPAFAAGPVSGCSPLVVNFTDASTGRPTAWSWDFGNGATSTLQNPSTTFFAPGTYTVTLTVKNADGSQTTSKTNYITVYEKPEVYFTADDSAGCFPFRLQLSDQSIASPGTVNTAWSWDFGDGTQSSEQNPKVSYTDAGLYTVSLKVTNNKGCWSTATKPGYVKVEGGVAVDFSFVRPPMCHTPFDVQFTNTSSGPGNLRYTWNFGDGTTSADASPLHVYATEGIYSVTLVTTSDKGCTDTLQKINLLNLQNSKSAFTAPDSVCLNQEVTFTNRSPAASALSWNFGDGTGSDSVSPVKSFPAAGTYTVKLLQTFDGCADSALKTIKVFPQPKATFTANRLTVCQPPLTVNFQGTSADAVSYQWQFGDGTTSAEANPSHTYTDYGDYTVTLIATNAGGCTDTLRVPGSVKIKQPSIAFLSLPKKGCLPFTTTLQANVSALDSVVAYHWDLGNGSTSNEATPTVTYTEQGAYNIRLTITTASGCTQTAEVSAGVSAGRKPQALFSGVPNQVCAFQPVQFTNLTNEGTQWLWDFGEGGTSTESNPFYQFNDTGTFSIKLVADNYGCKDSIVLADYITVKPPIAAFAYQPDCSRKLDYTFQDQSIGATSWTWDFGDGTTSTEQSPSHHFPGFGTYTVQLTVSNDTCSNTSKQEIKIFKTRSDFTVSDPAVCHGTDIVFTATNPGADDLVDFRWNLGDGSAPRSGTSVSAAYATAGTYTVSLTVTDSNGCQDSTVKAQLVQVNGPAAGFSSQNNNGCKGLEASFTDHSKSDGRNAIVQWHWNLGDGTVINNTKPLPVQHRFTTAGSFPVSLVVSDAGGCTDSLRQEALVNVSAIQADFSSTDSISCPGAQLQFTNQSTALTGFSSEWDFGNGTTSAQTHPTSAYQTEGFYTVRLKITDANGCTDTLSKTNFVSIRLPVASYTVSDSASSCIPLQVQFTNTSSNYEQLSWELNGGTSKRPNPVQSYNTPGVYHTSLIVKGHGGCADTATQTITVYDAAASKISYLPLDGCKPLAVNITAFSPQKMSFIWDFGDGSILNNNDLNSTHLYRSLGSFVPKVIMTDSQGCVVPITGLDTIRIKGATAKFGADKVFFCDNGTVRFSDSTVFNLPITGYSWDFGDGTTSQQVSPTHVFTKPGLYPVSLQVKTENGCVDTFRMEDPVKVVASPAIRIAGDSVICIGDGITHLGVFEKADTSLVRWSWRFPNGKTASVQQPPRQIYRELGRHLVRAMVVNSSGCVDSAFQPIVVHPVPTVTLPSTITTMIGTPVLLPAVYSDSMMYYKWITPEGLSCADCPQPFAAPRFDTKYTVQFESPNGCRNTGQVQVIVLCNNDNIFVPNTFSPNGDGSNDVFFVRGKGLSRVKSLRIFNRWGQVVFDRMNFSVNDASMGWDGKYKGAKPVPGVYVYQIEIFCDNSQVVKFEGNVALIE